MQTELVSEDSNSPRKSRLSVAALVVMRLVLACWVGAAFLFIWTSIAEQVSPYFNSTIRDQLAIIRFPFYYTTGTACCTLALASGVLCRSLNRRLTAALILITAASVIFACDYWLIYRPLQELIIPAGQPRTEQFVDLHTWSRNMNTFHLLLVLLAAIQALQPLPETTSR